MFARLTAEGDFATVPDPQAVERTFNSHVVVHRWPAASTSYGT
jgi:hypothetical protein